jgi:DNA-binding IclR family transcriptional regulator
MLWAVHEKTSGGVELPEPTRLDGCGDEDEDETAPRSVLGRVAAILDAFSPDACVLTLRELTVATGLPKSTVHRLTEQLVAFGWLERSFAGYRIGMRLFEVGGLAKFAKRPSTLRDRAAFHVQQLAARTGCAVHIAVLDRSEVLILGKLAGASVDVPTREGARLPAHCTALGKVLLAFAPEEELRAVIDRGLPPCTSRTITDEPELRAELESIRELGYATDDQESAKGSACVAAPIRGAGRALGAVSVTGHTESFDWRFNRIQVVETAHAVWAEMFTPGSRRSPERGD